MIGAYTSAAVVCAGEYINCSQNGDSWLGSVVGGLDGQSLGRFF